MKIILLVGFLVLLSASVLAQNQGIGIIQTPQKVMSEKAREQRQQSSFERTADKRAQKNENGLKINFIRRVSLAFRAPLRKEQRQRLMPDAQLISRYAVFLGQPRTGMIKLFQDAGCEENVNILRADAGCLEWIPNSAFYSFREKEHSTDYLSDITYKNGFLVTDGILSQGILTTIGDVPLENVSLATGGMKFLIDYQPEIHSRDALNQFVEISKGLKSGDYEYRKAVQAVENTTYLLRIIAYRASLYSMYRGRLFDVLYGNKRVDSILALRVLRKNAADGSLTLLWKEIDRKKSPKMLFRRKETTRADKSSKS